MSEFHQGDVGLSVLEKISPQQLQVLTEARCQLTERRTFSCSEGHVLSFSTSKPALWRRVRLIRSFCSHLYGVELETASHSVWELSLEKDLQKDVEDHI